MKDTSIPSVVSDRGESVDKIPMNTKTWAGHNADDMDSNTSVNPVGNMREEQESNQY